MNKYLAVDIGASSGRHIVGWRNQNGELQTKEVYRFPNGVDKVDGHLTWDVARLEQAVRDGIDAAPWRSSPISCPCPWTLGGWTMCS